MPVPAVLDAMAFGVAEVPGVTGNVVDGPWPAIVSADGDLLKPSIGTLGIFTPVLHPTEPTTAIAKPPITSRCRAILFAIRDCIVGP